MVWGALVLLIAVPLAFAASSPLLQWREPVYIVAGLAGVAGMGILLAQPLLAGGLLPGLSASVSRRLHAWVGAALVVAVIIHVVALWITSPPDARDALLFRAPTLFSYLGVIAMWAVFAAGLLAFFRRSFRPRVWRVAHSALAVVIVGCSVGHALLIVGTMETISKSILCTAVICAGLWGISARRRRTASLPKK